MSESRPEVFPKQRQAIEEMSVEWRLFTDETSRIAEWRAAIDAMRSTMRQLEDDGRWPSGSRTLLEELGIATKEVIMCRALAWLLVPSGWHGLGRRFLDRFLTEVGVPALEDGFVSVEREVPRGNTRADVVIRTPSTTVVVEAKINAIETDNQCDQLSEVWEDESASLVFLTRVGYRPLTARTSADLWTPISWADVVRLADSAVREVSEARHPQAVHPGVLELVNTFRYSLK